MERNLLGRTFARRSFIQALGAEAFVRAMLEFEGALAEAIVAELEPALEEELRGLDAAEA